MPSEHDVVAPHRIDDWDLGRVVYAKGEVMTREDAIKYGVISESTPEADKTPEPSEPTKRAKRKTADRSKKIEHDRAK